MDEGMKNWHNALRRGVQFSKTTKCDTLEVLYYPSLTDLQWIEGSADDSTLSQWLYRVRLVCNARVPSLLMHFFRLPACHVQELRGKKYLEVVCDYCKSQSRVV